MQRGLAALARFPTARAFVVVAGGVFCLFLSVDVMLRQRLLVLLLLLPV